MPEQPNSPRNMLNSALGNQTQPVPRRPPRLGPRHLLRASGAERFRTPANAHGSTPSPPRKPGGGVVPRAGQLDQELPTFASRPAIGRAETAVRGSVIDLSTLGPAHTKSPRPRLEAGGFLVRSRR